MGGLSIWHWIIIIIAVVLIFGTKKLPNIGNDLASAIKNFRKGMQDEDEANRLKADPPADTTTGSTEQNRVEK